MGDLKPGSGIQRALLGAVWLSAAGYLAFAMNFGLNLVLARLLFPKDFGQFALAGSLAEILSLVTGFSFSAAIIQMRDAPGIVETAYVLSLRLYAGLLAGGLILAMVLSPHYPGVFLPLFLSLFAVRNLSVLSYVYSALLERTFRYNPLSAIRLCSAFVSIAAALVLARLGAGVWSLLGREVALVVVTFMGVRIASGWRYRGGYNRDTARRVWRFGRQMFVARALEIVWYRGDTALLGVLAGTLSLGFYDRARYLAEFGHYVVSVAAVQVAFPVYARLQGRAGALTYAYRLSHGLLVRLLLPFCVWLAVFPNEIVSLLYGAGVRWVVTAEILPWFAIFGLVFPVVENIKVLLIGIGRLREAVAVRLAQVIVALPLLVPAIRLWGAWGAAGTMVLSEFAGLVVGYRAMRSQVSSLFLAGYLRPGLAALVAGGTVAVARSLHAFPWVGRLGSAANLAAVAIIYAVCLVLVDRREVEELLLALLAGFRGETPAGLAGETVTGETLPGAVIPVADVDGRRRSAFPVTSQDPP